jgi:hypothetical protein
MTNRTDVQPSPDVQEREATASQLQEIARSMGWGGWSASDIECVEYAIAALRTPAAPQPETPCPNDGPTVDPSITYTTCSLCAPETPKPEVGMGEYDRYLLARIEVARQHCYDISAGRKTWRMSILAQDDDSDVLLDDVLDSAAKRIRELTAAKETK